MHLQANLTLLIKQHLVETIEMERVKIDGDGLLGIDKRILHPTLTLVLGIEFEVLHHIAQQDARLKHLHLVVDTCGVRQEAKVLHIGKHLRRVTALFLVLHQHATRHLVHRTGIAQVEQRGGEADDERQEKPLPVQH